MNENEKNSSSGIKVISTCIITWQLDKFHLWIKIMWLNRKVKNSYQCKWTLRWDCFIIIFCNSILEYFVFFILFPFQFSSNVYIWEAWYSTENDALCLSVFVCIYAHVCIHIHIPILPVTTSVTTAGKLLQAAEHSRITLMLD